MTRKETAEQTLRILRQGSYELDGRQIEISALHQASVQGSRYIPAEALVEPPRGSAFAAAPECRARNVSTVAAVQELAGQGIQNIGVLNFASAKNPGGGFLNGAMAQEESLAASSGLYETLLEHPQYYARNRACGTMCYTDDAIYSPGVVFFRDERFTLVGQPFVANVLTLPAVNFGQVLLKGEDPARAQRVMKARMRRALRIFAAAGDKTLILGAYGCGVFRNDPEKVARWWDELLKEPEFSRRFARIVFAVLDRSKDQKCLRAFQAHRQEQKV